MRGLPTSRLLLPLLHGGLLLCGGIVEEVLDGGAGMAAFGGGK